MVIKINDFGRWVKIDRGCAVGDKVDLRMRQYIMSRDKWACVYCGDRNGPLEIDHITPMSRGGLSVEQNLVCSCLPCNRSKKDKTPEEWGVK